MTLGDPSGCSWDIAQAAESQPSADFAGQSLDIGDEGVYTFWGDAEAGEIAAAQRGAARLFREIEPFREHIPRRVRTAAQVGSRQAARIRP
jgi:hypothetical protein